MTKKKYSIAVLAAATMLYCGVSTGLAIGSHSGPYDQGSDGSNEFDNLSYDCEIVISGATLFRSFFYAPASTNDYIDADNDGYAGKYLSWPPQNLCTLFTDVPSGGPWNYSTIWEVQYRGVGSGGGLEELLRADACSEIPTEIPEPGLFSRFEYASGGINWGGPYDDVTGTPKTPETIDFAVMDVPSCWFLQGPAGTPAWSAGPTQTGYGQNSLLSWDTGYGQELVSLNVDCDGDTIPEVTYNADTANPDGNTLFDTPIAFVPIAMIANRGTGLENVKETELQHLFVTGRMPSGENLLAVTRPYSSGTRNGAMNTIGVDPSWGRGDNLGTKNSVDQDFLLGPTSQWTNCKGSSDLERAVENHRLGVGYNGLPGSSGAARDTKYYRYEILNVMFDNRGGSNYVRPTIDTCLDNADPNTGYQIGGAESFITLGDPDETDDTQPWYIPECPRNYIKNITESIKDFVSVPGDPENDAMPGEYLATTFFLLAGVDAVPQDPTGGCPNPVNWTDQRGTAEFNQDLQDYMRLNNGLGIGEDTPAYGSTSPANKVPSRQSNVNGYTDGTTNENVYFYCGYQIGGGYKLSQSNRLAGDFNLDDSRDINDADLMVQAWFDPRNFNCTDNGGAKGDMTLDVAIPEVIGDYNGDGDFSKEDLRYWMDGLAIDPATGQLDRKAGAIAIDNAILANGPATDGAGNPVSDTSSWLPWSDPNPRIIDPSMMSAGDNPYFVLPSIDVNDAADPFLATGKTYQAGDFRGDVAGMSAYPGAQPNGWDGKVDCADIDYVRDNFGTWSDLNVAVFIDLSCDMDGDLDVDEDDVAELVQVILGTDYGDVNLDGAVDATDSSIINANLGMTDAGWCDGDMNGDGVVDTSDLPAQPFSMVAAEAVKAHGSAGEFGIDMMATGATDPRFGGPEKIVLTFEDAGGPVDVQAADGSLDVTIAPDTSGEIVLSQGSGSATAAGNTVTVSVSGLTDQSCLQVTVQNIARLSDASVLMQPNPANAQIALLTGDVYQGGGVTATDIAYTKYFSGSVVSDELTMRSDVYCDGSVTSTDIAYAKYFSGASASCP